MISDYEILTFMKQSDDPAFTPNEIADHFDLTNSAARRRLYNLVEDGKARIQEARSPDGAVLDRGRLLDRRFRNIVPESFVSRPV